MEPIPEELVDETWQEFAGYSPVRAKKETIKVNKNQPNLLAFMMEFTQDLDQELNKCQMSETAPSFTDVLIFFKKINI